MAIDGPAGLCRQDHTLQAFWSGPAGWLGHNHNNMVSCIHSATAVPPSYILYIAWNMSPLSIRGPTAAFKPSPVGADQYWFGGPAGCTVNKHGRQKVPLRSSRPIGPITSIRALTDILPLYTVRHLGDTLYSTDWCPPKRSNGYPTIQPTIQLEP